MNLTIQRPIIFFDLETTGTSITRDRIVEISMLKIVPGEAEPRERTMLINPEMPIPAEATAVHHITDADVAGKPTFRDIAEKLRMSFEGCDIGGFNSNKFDLPLLTEEFHRAGIDFDVSAANLIDVQTIFHKKEQRTLVAAYKFYCDADLTAAHSAKADTRATYEVLLAQLDRYNDLPNDVKALSEYSSQNRNVDLMGRMIRNDKGEEVFNFGKHKGRTVESVLASEPTYYRWMMDGDFPYNTKLELTKIYERFNAKKKANRTPNRQ